jgi:hypothetical protein
MMRNQIDNFRNFAAQVFLGSIALALVTMVFIWLQVDLASVAVAYLIMIVSALKGSFNASPLLARISIAGLAYFLLRQFSIFGSTRLQAGGVVVRLDGRQPSHHLSATSKEND